MAADADPTAGPRNPLTWSKVGDGTMTDDTARAVRMGTHHVHDGEWCYRCVDHGRVLAARPSGLLREAAQRFIDWFDSPGRSYRRDGEGSAAVAALRAALATPDEPVAGLDDGYWEKAYWNLVPKLLAIISDDRAIAAARLREDEPG